MNIDLNVDVGEGFPYDVPLLGLASQANICCGTHAGSRDLARTTAALCRAKGVKFGAHPGLDDRPNMGRGPMPSYSRETWSELRSSIRCQIEDLLALGATYVKPHGTLYNESADHQAVGELMASCLAGSGLPLMGLPSTLHEEIARAANVGFIREAFADRAYSPDGRLVPRDRPGAVLTVLEEVLMNVGDVAGNCDSICVHGDTPGCVEFARAVRNYLLELN